MKTYCVQVELTDTYEKFIEAESLEDAKRIANLDMDEDITALAGYERIDGSSELTYCREATAQTE